MDADLPIYGLGESAPDAKRPIAARAQKSSTFNWVRAEALTQFADRSDPEYAATSIFNPSRVPRLFACRDRHDIDFCRIPASAAMTG
jgi:hypothetical protein